MRPRLHLAVAAVCLIVPMTAVMLAGVLAFNSLELADWWVLPICLSWFVALKLVSYLLRNCFLLARCPDCGARCAMLFSPEITYDCTQCAYRWETGWSDSGGSGDLN